MIRELKLKFGRVPGLVAETVPTTPITVFVGPNNSGKSKVLAEINQFCRSGQINITDVILDHLEFHNFALEQAEEHIRAVTLTPNPGETQLPELIIIGKGSHRMQLNKQQLLTALQQPEASVAQFCQWYLAFNTLILDGRGRIDLVNDQIAGDLQQVPQSSFQVLFRDDAKRLEVRRIIYDAFELYFVIDPTNLGNLRARLSRRCPTSHREERGIHAEAVEFHREAQPIVLASDGVKAFTGIITQIIAGDPRVLLVDEPEAFLHPSLAYKLGKEIAKASLGSEKRLFVSTHSPYFVMGCIQSGAPINIIRLTYRNGVATARILPNNDILRLMRNPLLRSANVISGLFYEFVVVAESDADRAFYQEINERLLRFKPEWGIPNCLFLNAQNKQTVQTIIRPLRELGIPAAAVIDIDVLKEGGQVWTNLLSSAFVPSISHQPLGSHRAAINQKLEMTGRDMKRDGGVELLQGPEKEAANNLLDQMNEYGIFVVRKGELESWLNGLGASGHGPSWLIDIFEKMGEEPDTNGYVRPNDEDVWSFLGDIKCWLTNPDRKGIPA